MKSCPSCGYYFERVEPDARLGPLSLELAGDVYWRGRRIHTTRHEMIVLHHLAASPGVFHRREAFENVLDTDAESDTITVYICRLRKKFKAVDPDFDRIETRREVGYRWALREPRETTGLHVPEKSAI